MYMGSLSNKKYHLLWSIVLGVAVMLLLSGCNSDRNKPYNFLNSVWVCEEAHACIAVTERESQAYSYGEIERDGKTVPITMVYFNGLQGALLDFSKAYSYETIFTPEIEADKYLWRGYIDYGRKEFTLEKTFDSGRKYPLLSDEDLPLTFVRYDCTQEELLPLLPWDEEENLKADFEPGKLLELGMEIYVEDPPKKKITWFDLSDFWPDPFGVSDKQASAPEPDAS